MNFGEGHKPSVSVTVLIVKEVLFLLHFLSIFTLVEKILM